MNTTKLIEQIGGRERLEELASFKPSGSNSVNSASREEWMAMARALLAVLDAQEKPSIEVEKMNVERQALICWLKNEIKLIESARDEIPFGLDADGEMALKGIRTALSALEAKPVCYTGSGSMEAVKVGCEGYIWRDCENSHPIGLYTTPPAASVPEWSNAQCMEFLTVAFRHCDISGDIEMDDVRLGVKMANAADPAPGGEK